MALLLEMTVDRVYKEIFVLKIKITFLREETRG